MSSAAFEQYRTRLADALADYDLADAEAKAHKQRALAAVRRHLSRYRVRRDARAPSESYALKALLRNDHEYGLAVEDRGAAQRKVIMFGGAAMVEWMATR